MSAPKVQVELEYPIVNGLWLAEHSNTFVIDLPIAQASQSFSDVRSCSRKSQETYQPSGKEGGDSEGPSWVVGMGELVMTDEVGMRYL